MPLRLSLWLLGSICLVVVIALSADLHEPSTGQPFRVLPASRTGVTFHHRNGAMGRKEMIEMMGSGVALFDYNGDGKLDIFLLNGAAIPSLEKTGPAFFNRLYRNDGDFHFTDVTAVAGLQGNRYGMGVTCGDYDNDGYADLYVTQFGENQLFHNLGNGRFEDVTRKAGVAAGGWSTSAAFLDYDRDGLVDLFVARYLTYPLNANPGCGDPAAGLRSYCLPDQFPATTNILYHNNGDGTFTDVSMKAGIQVFRGKALGVGIADLDGDGWPDIVVANDRMPNALFRNRRNGTFEEVGTRWGTAYSSDGIARAGMGVDITDFDGDGKPDIIISNFEAEGLALFHNQGGFFEDESGSRGLYEPSYKFVGFGLKFVDYDNDGRPDIFAVNGHVLDDIDRYRPGASFPQPKLIFQNQGGHFALMRPSYQEPLSTPRVGRGLAVGDLNNDGLVDVVVNNNGEAPDVIANQPTRMPHHSVLFRFIGTVSNRDALGTDVSVRCGGTVRTYQITGSGSYLSHNDTRLHIGLGRSERIDELTLSWPDGRREIIRDVAGDNLYEIQEGRGIVSASRLNRRSPGSSHILPKAALVQSHPVLDNRGDDTGGKR